MRLLNYITYDATLGFMLFTFLLLLWAADRFLSLFVWIVVIGTNVYWLIHVIQKTTAGRLQQRHQ